MHAPPGGRATTKFVPRTRRKALAGRVADAVLTRLADGPLRPVGRPLPLHPRVLVVRLDHLGDAVMATAVLEPLAEALEPERLDVLCGSWAREVFAGHPAVTEVLTADMPWWLAARGVPMAGRLAAWSRLPAAVRMVRARRYDVVVELRGDLRQILLFATWADAGLRVGTDRTGGAALLDRVWPFDGTPHEVEKASQIAGLLGVRRVLRPLMRPSAPSAALEGLVRDAAAGRPLVVLALTGTEPNRSWPASHAAELSRRLAAVGVASLLVGGRRDTRYAAAVHASGGVVTNLAGQTTIGELAWVFSQGAVAVCTDSGPMHVASAVGTPVVALFGPGDPSQSMPWGGDVEVVAHETPCGCVHPWCDRTPGRSLRGAGPGACMQGIGPDVVFEKIQQRLGGA